MAVSEHGSGTQSAVIDTEHFLGTDPESTDGAFQFVVNLANMARGDELEIRVYEAALPGDTSSEQAVIWHFLHEQNDTIFISPAMILLHRWRFSIKQTAGTGRSYKWSIRKVA